jgi:L-serine deaminase
MHDLFRERSDAMNARIEAALPDGVERYVYYSSEETAVMKGIGTAPVDNLDKVAVEGPVTFLLSAGDHFSVASISDDFDICEVAEKEHFSEVMESTHISGGSGDRQRVHNSNEGLPLD